MKISKMASILLSAIMCVSMMAIPAGVLADETEAASETKTTEAAETEPKETKKKETEPAEKKETEAPAEKETEPAETEKQETEPAETEKQEPKAAETEKKETEPAEAEKQEPEETVKQEPEATEETLPKISAKKKAVKAYSGKLGKNITWALDDNGTLTVSGTGNMPLVKDGAAWKPYASSVKKIVIGEGITTVSHYAFASFTELKRLELPTTVTTIGNYAFDGCKNLSSIRFSKGLETIRSGAFRKTAITVLKLPQGVKTIWDEAFLGCTELTEARMPTSVKEIQPGAFESCTNLRHFYLSAALYTSLTPYFIFGRSPFDHCDNMAFIFTTQFENNYYFGGKTVKIKAKKLKKKSVTMPISKVMEIVGDGDITYYKVSGNKKIVVDPVKGKVTVKKKLKKGTYKVKVKIRAEGNFQFKPSPWQTVTFKIKVK